MPQFEYAYNTKTKPPSPDALAAAMTAAVTVTDATKSSLPPIVGQIDRAITFAVGSAEDIYWGRRTGVVFFSVEDDKKSLDVNEATESGRQVLDLASAAGLLHSQRHSEHAFRAAATGIVRFGMTLPKS